MNNRVCYLFMFMLALQLSFVSSTLAREIQEYEEREGVIHALGEVEPYTGQIVEYYPLKLKKSQKIVNGKIEENIFYYENGQVKSRQQYKEDGSMIFTTYYENGLQKHEGHYLNGLRHGPDRSWNWKGQLYFESMFKNGRLHGLKRQHYANGQKMEEGNWINGKGDGCWKHWYENGQLQERFHFKMGKRHGPYQKWFENGKPWVECTYQDDKRSGSYQEWAIIDGTHQLVLDKEYQAEWNQHVSFSDLQHIELNFLHDTEKLKKRIPHPPSFQDLQPFLEYFSLLPDDIFSEDSEPLQILKNQGQALGFSEADETKIRSTNDARLLAGIALSTFPKNEEDLALLEEAFNLAHNEEYIMAFLIYGYHRVHVYPTSAIAITEENAEIRTKMGSLINEFMKRAPTNALAYYFMAYYQHYLEQNNERTLEYIRKGNHMQNYNRYRKEQHQAIYEALLAVGYSPFSAFYNSQQSVFFDFMIMSLCRKLIDEEGNNTFISECIQFGKRLDQSSFLQGFQRRMIEKSCRPDRTKLLSEFETMLKNRELLEKQIRHHLIELFFYSPELPNVRHSEAFWRRYLELEYAKDLEGMLLFLINERKRAFKN